MNEAAISLAYRHCEEITRTRARNFYYGIRLLPQRKRAAMCALYAMARRVDDAGDDTGTGPLPAGAAPGRDGPDEPDSRLVSLEAIRSSLEVLRQVADGRPGAVVPPGDPVLTALADTMRHFPVDVDTLLELVEGCEWDVQGRSYDTADELVEYCRRVAGSIGRLSLAIYGSTDDALARPLADSLGVALQLTNILRDVREDLEVMGRVYLPREDRERFGVGPHLEGRQEDLMALVCFESARAAEWYERGLPLLSLLDQRSRACTAAMAGIYRRLLERVRSRPDAPLRTRVALPATEKARVAVLALARGVAA